MTLLSTTLSQRGKKTQTIKVFMEENGYTVTQEFGLVTITTRGMTFKEAYQEYNRIISSYYWESL